MGALSPSRFRTSGSVTVRSQSSKAPSSRRALPAAPLELQLPEGAAIGVLAREIELLQVQPLEDLVLEVVPGWELVERSEEERGLRARRHYMVAF